MKLFALLMILAAGCGFCKSESFDDHPSLMILLADLETCGQTNGTQRVIGKTPKLFENPWEALIGYHNKNKQFKIVCAGSLISSRFVLTVAHCPKEYLKYVRLGDYNLTTEVDCMDGETKKDSCVCAPEYQELDVMSYMPHPEYSNITKSNDIGLVRMVQKAEYNENVIPICLPYTEELQKARIRSPILIGYNRFQNEVLSHKTVNFMNTVDCTVFLHDLNIPYSSNILCSEEKGDCISESGSPIYVYGYYNNSLKAIQYGISAAGLPDCSRGINMKVTGFLEFILDSMELSERQELNYKRII